MVVWTTDAKRLVFVDEIGPNTSLSPFYVWALKGETCCSVPGNRGWNMTLLASKTAEGMRSCVAVEGVTIAVIFETYVEKVLATILRHRKVVVLDNPFRPTRPGGCAS